ncbi:CoA-transferase subunit beta [Natrarchaeobius chitinivorans]|uniref:CoA-transferase subunit beta n=1 Tax=Natrarchaeobius chitinivorans TaxID=1679083 RepID=A0A3N6PE31_NATCH|nr:CoA-transferase [Natrarchaeobius chitinivorans]RQG95445.1 CoA-transferase subunit beta [Natrarchaeobius chitinivorans]
MTEYTKSELMVASAAREIHDDDAVFVGIGVPTLACGLAKQLHAPNLTMIYESGTIDTTFDELPLSIGDPELAGGSRSIVSLYDVFCKYLQAGRIDVGFLGGAQIDRYGNINSTVIGDYDDPTVRLPGSGGACEIASNANRTVIITPHEPRRLPESVDFATSPGHVTTDDEPTRSGSPEAIITDKAIMRFDESGDANVESIHPGVRPDEVQQATGWELSLDGVDETAEPKEKELDIIRNRLDPNRRYTG